MSWSEPKLAPVPEGTYYNWRKGLTQFVISAGATMYREPSQYAAPEREDVSPTDGTAA